MSNANWISNNVACLLLSHSDNLQRMQKDNATMQYFIIDSQIHWNVGWIFADDDDDGASIVCSYACNAQVVLELVCHHCVSQLLGTFYSIWYWYHFVMWQNVCIENNVKWEWQANIHGRTHAMQLFRAAVACLQFLSSLFVNIYVINCICHGRVCLRNEDGHFWIEDSEREGEPRHFVGTVLVVSCWRKDEYNCQQELSNTSRWITRWMWIWQTNNEQTNRKRTEQQQKEDH